MATACLFELTEPDISDGYWLTGRFAGDVEANGRTTSSCEDLDIDAALAWARERAEKALIRVGGSDYFSAGDTHPPSAPRWPPKDLEPLVRRRHPDDRWRDRTAADPPITWTVGVQLAPPGDRQDYDEDQRRRDEWCDLTAQVARAAEAVRWDSALFDKSLNDRLRARAEAAPGEGWFVYESAPAVFRLLLDAEAATAQEATEQALRRCELPGGWTATAAAVPTAVVHRHRGPQWNA